MGRAVEAILDPTNELEWLFGRWTPWLSIGGR
jgi:hypothetical protein